MIFRVLAILAAIALPVMADCASATRNLASLIDPAKLSTLGKRAANPRIQKAIAIMEDARRDGCEISSLASNAVFVAGYTNALLAQMTRDALTRNHGIAEKLGTLDVAGMSEMCRGKSPTIKRGKSRGDELSADHIVPFAVAPELGNVIANLELLPLRLNESKNDKIGERQRELAEKFFMAGLIRADKLRLIKSK